MSPTRQFQNIINPSNAPTTTITILIICADE